MNITNDLHAGLAPQTRSNQTMDVHTTSSYIHYNLFNGIMNILAKAN
jgi:hypothetical protein